MMHYNVGLDVKMQRKDKKKTKEREREKKKRKINQSNHAQSIITNRINPNDKTEYGAVHFYFVWDAIILSQSQIE